MHVLIAYSHYHLQDYKQAIKSYMTGLSIFQECSQLFQDKSKKNTTRKHDPKDILKSEIEVIKNMEALSIGAGKYAITVFREDPSPYLKRALETLEAIGKARAAGDAVTLTDALEYEAIPLLEEMGRALFVSGGSNPC